MFSLSMYCSVCHCERNEREVMFKVNYKDKQIIKRLNYCRFEIDWLDSNTIICICHSCYVQVQTTYSFIDMCRRNSTILRGYITLLNNANARRKKTIHCIPIDEESESSDSEFILVVQNNETEEVNQKKAQNVTREFEVMSPSEISTTFSEKSTKESTTGESNTKEDETSLNVELVLVDETNDNDRSSKETDNRLNEQAQDVEIVVLRDNCTVESLFLQEYNFEAQKHLMTYDENNIISEPNSSDGNTEPKNTGKKLVKCEVCNKKFKSKSKCIIHMRKHTGEKPFACKFCDKRYTRLENMQEHTLTHGQKPFQCPDCGEKFLFRKSIKKHQITHCGVRQKKVTTNGKQFKCVICKENFESELFLVSHMAVHNDTMNKCPECNGLFLCKGELDEHILTHSGVEEYKCTVCNKEFDTNSVFKRHALIHGTVSLECTVCSKKFATEILLERHKLLHSGEEPHSCSVCAEKFLFRHQLGDHMLMHKAQEYTCSFCGKIFNIKSKLNRHMKIHTRGKPYVCTVCNKSFASEEYLKSHQAFHTGNKPHECVHCHKRFTIRQTLYNHKLVCVPQK